MKNLTWQNPEQLFVAQELINKVKSKCCGIKDNYGLYFLKSIYNALFICLVWYSKFLAENHTNSGNVEFDEDLQVYHVNNVLLPTMSNNCIGAKVRLLKKTRNTQSKTKRKYPYFSKYERIE